MLRRGKNSTPMARSMANWSSCCLVMPMSEARFTRLSSVPNSQYSVISRWTPCVSILRWATKEKMWRGGGGRGGGGLKGGGEGEELVVGGDEGGGAVRLDVEVVDEGEDGGVAAVAVEDGPL